MTETQAKSGTTGTSMNPVTRDQLEGDHSDLDPTADHVVGRASVPTDGASKIQVDEQVKSGAAGDVPATSSSPSGSPAASATSTASGSVATATATSTLASGSPSGSD